MHEYYKDEHPKPPDPPKEPEWIPPKPINPDDSPGGDSSGGGAGGSSPPPSSWGGGSVSGDKPRPPTESPWYTISAMWGVGLELPLCDGNEILLMHDIYVLRSVGGCINIQLQCQVKGDGSDVAENPHINCIVFYYQARQKNKDGTAWIPGDFADGIIDIYAKWQKGHYDYSKQHTVRFRLLHDEKNISPWFKLPLGGSGKGKKIATFKASMGIINVESWG